MKKKIFNNKNIYLFVTISTIIFFVLLGCWYINNASRNIVFMDFWRNINRIIPIVKKEPFFNVLDNLWFNDFGQSNYLQTLLVAIDIKYFNLNCLWEEYAGIVILTIQSIILIKHINKIIFNSYQKNTKDLIYKIITSILIIVFVFNLNQWEILSLQFSLAFMIRILLYNIIFILFNNSIINNKSFFKVGILSFITITLLSQLYFPALLISCFFVQLVYYFFNMKVYKENKIFIKSLKFWIPSIIAVIIYFSFGVSNASAGDTSGISQIIILIKNGTFIKGFFYMLTSSLIHQNILTNISDLFIILIGIFVFIILLFVIYYSIKQKNYKKALLPYLMIIYGFVSIFAIIYARGDFGVFYLTSSRYTVETNCIWIGLLILVMQLTSEQKILKITKIISSIGLCIVFILLIVSYKEEINISKYRGSYKDELINLIKETELTQIEDEKLESFQSSPELVREGIKKMKKYKLNIFSE